MAKSLKNAKCDWFEVHGPLEQKRLKVGGCRSKEVFVKEKKNKKSVSKNQVQGGEVHAAVETKLHK